MPAVKEVLLVAILFVLLIFSLIDFAFRNGVLAVTAMLWIWQIKGLLHVVAMVNIYQLRDGKEA
jgi:hypothetical protein